MSENWDSDSSSFQNGNKPLVLDLTKRETRTEKDLVSLYHETTLVLKEVRVGVFEILEPAKLPFNLLGREEISYSEWLKWIDKRIAPVSRVLSRTL